jgi:hypothetical protein
MIAIALAIVAALLVSERVRCEEPRTIAQVDAALSWWVRVAPRHPLRVREYRAEVVHALLAGANRYALPVEVVVAMSMRESSGRQDARGAAGELGLLQVSPDTAVRFRCLLSTPTEQVDCGCRVLARHLTRCGTLRGALAAYGSRSGACSPPVGGSVEKMVKDRMALAADVAAVMEGK